MMERWAIYRPDAITIWQDPVVSERLSWYYSVMKEEKPAKFIISKKIGIENNPYNLDLKELWKMHEKASREFYSLLKDVKNGFDINKLEKPKYSYLDSKIAIAQKLMDPCVLCERRCGAKRKEGKIGICLMGNECIVHSFFHHLGEEPPLVPSGTIFYGGCNFKCVFCQNYDISQIHAREGEMLNAKELALIQKDLRIKGARNINHVGGEPTPHIPFILESFNYLDINVPQLWNSNMYMSEESLELLIDIIDIWLPDFKYGNNDCAFRLSKIKNYWEVVTRNIKMVYDSGGDMIIRHLVLPNHVECCTRKVLEWISKNTPNVLVNIMDQYRPEHLVAKFNNLYPDIARMLNKNEIKKAYEIAENLGLFYKQIL